MIFTPTKLAGAYEIDIKKIGDSRGFFARAYCQKEFAAHGLNTNLVQANISRNQHKGTLRGLHMQRQPYAETKLVRCTRGAIYDVIADMRPDSDTYLQWIGVELTADNYKMLYVPEGFAHSYITLQDDSEIFYQVTQFYEPSAEVGFRWDDPALNINWPTEPVIISDRDMGHPFIQPIAS